jgi:hypothetical protein
MDPDGGAYPSAINVSKWAHMPKTKNSTAGYKTGIIKPHAQREL